MKVFYITLDWLVMILERSKPRKQICIQLVFVLLMSVDDFIKLNNMGNKNEKYIYTDH